MEVEEREIKDIQIWTKEMMTSENMDQKELENIKTEFGEQVFIKDEVHEFDSEPIQRQMVTSNTNSDCAGIEIFVYDARLL